ncbi:unnamed protein product [Colletotrichum noveboracense]|uniref:Amidohydrolase-related domain-containing protein n=1 Tax=Colletotrichum noveboracense TaxID=2664923 RepID=A0A9W4RY09_9PEZI|nr:hypothetical protein K456DRAFT_1826025 [Colletotrichum gloeosporioides 23]CAI0650042.1 unnamed protein product [Colletotrichum noveboracense]
MRIVAAEEHFSSTAFDGQLPAHHPGFEWPVSQLRDIGVGRIADMDKHGISTQVLSQTVYNVKDIERCHKTNDQLYEAVKAYPARFAAFACLPTAHPEKAVAEFRRCIRELGFKGALINNTVDGEFLDNREYFPIFQAAADLGVPIYIHPSFPSPTANDVLFSGDTISPEAAFMVSTGAWGWHSEVGLNVVRLISIGLFDKLPNLQIIIGHGGEMVPVMIGRIEDTLGKVMKKAGHRKGPLQCLRENFYITTSGMFTTTPLKTLVDIMPMDRICFSVDYPYASNEDGKRLINSIDFLDAEQMKLFTHGNLDRLLGLDWNENTKAKI